MPIRKYRSILLLWACAAALEAQQPEAVLRIEAGMHTGSIGSISVDAAERFLVTGSMDKTIRVWDLPAGRLLRIIRPPVGAGNEGEIGSVAISPDGKTIAAAGITGQARRRSVYIFDRESGVLRRQIAGLPNVVDCLAYSPDGRMLAAFVAGVGDLGLYNAADYSSLGWDSRYGSEGYGLGVAFSPDSRNLVTTSFDGYIRTYDVTAGLHLLRKEKAPGGKQPGRVAFSPDGSRVAVGYDDAPRVDVLAARDLSLLFFRTAASEDLRSVAWSRDGEYLFAGAHMSVPGDTPIFRWNSDGSHARQLTAARNLITGLVPLRGGNSPSPPSIPASAFWTEAANGFCGAVHPGPTSAAPRCPPPRTDCWLASDTNLPKSRWPCFPLLTVRSPPKRCRPQFSLR